MPSSWWWIGVVATSSGLLAGVTGPIVKASLQNVTLPETRGQAFALFNTFDDFGRGTYVRACTQYITLLYIIKECALAQHF